MGRRGPAPTPSSILKLRGTFRKERSRNEPAPPPDLPLCPDWLDEQAKQAWSQLVPQLQHAGVLTAVDGGALARYCQLFARWKSAEQFLQKHGQAYPIKDEAGKTKCLVQFPQVSIAAKLAVLLGRLEQEFGMTPSSRTRIQVTPPKEREEDPVNEFLRMS